MPDMSQTELEEGLRAWAKGLKPMMAGVELLIRTRSVYPGHPLVLDYPGITPIALNMEKAGEFAKSGYLSSGERATWQLALSMLHGELDKSYWAIDPERQAVVLAVLREFA